MSMNTVPERLAALRAAMAANGVAVYLIPVGDPHASEYLPCHYTSLTWFSGFHGENSNFVVTRTESALWADGRYFVQAEKEIAGTEIKLQRIGEPGVPTVEEYCANALNEGEALGLCGLTASTALVNDLKKALEKKGASIKTHKVLIMTTQVTYEGSDVGVYEVGKRVKNRFRFLEAHDMTIEAVVTKSMWLLAQNCESFDQLQQRFYRQVNFDTFYH